MSLIARRRAIAHQESLALRHLSNAHGHWPTVAPTRWDEPDTGTTAEHTRREQERLKKARYRAKRRGQAA